jgi:hypothetical protein
MRAVLLSTTVTFACLILASIIINSSEQENTGPTNETLADRDYYSNSINDKQNIVDMRVSGNNISSASSKDDGDFVSIFDRKTLNGWKMAGDGRFVIVESDAALQSDKGGGLLWYSAKEYKNFILKLDWKI